MQRRTTNTVHVGDIAIGSGHPIAVQSMLCVAPSDLAANIAQTLVLKEAGCDIVRLAIPTMDDIRLISAIKNEVDIPLVADIQFDYRLAIAAVKPASIKSESIQATLAEVIAFMPWQKPAVIDISPLGLVLTADRWKRIFCKNTAAPPRKHWWNRH